MATYRRHKDRLAEADKIVLSVVAVAWAQDRPLAFGELLAAEALLARLPVPGRKPA